MEAIEKHYGADIVSVELIGPFVGDNGFAVKFHMDITNKPSGQRMQMIEAALYFVSEGKIVREEFYYNAAGGGA